jgi:hypothetical protein
MCSGVGVTMTFVVGLAVLMRRGWRAAALNTAPLAAVYLVWYVAYGRDSYAGRHGTISSVSRFVATGYRNAFGHIGQVPGIGVALAVVLVLGLAVAWTRIPFDTLRRRASAPAALLVGSAVFLAISGYGRSILGSGFARESRYVHLVAAMTLPALAVGADALVRRWRFVFPAVVALLLIGVPGNISAIDPSGAERVTLGNRVGMLELPRSPFARAVPRSTHPNPRGAAEVTIGWLLDGVADGRIPAPSHVTPDVEAGATLSLLLDQIGSTSPTTSCMQVKRPVRRSVRKGDVLVFRGGPWKMQLIESNGQPSSAFGFSPFNGSAIRVRGGPISVVIDPVKGSALELCRGR